MAVDRPIAESASPGVGRTPLSPDLIAQRGFGVARRGFDQAEVRGFLQQVSGEVQALRAQIDELERLRREAEERAAHPVLDEDTLMEAVGEETATILRAARAAAAEMRDRAGRDATRVAAEAEEAAARRRAEAEEMLATTAEEAEQHANEVLESARSEADDLLAKARDEAQQIKGQAERERRMTVEAAQSVREKILADLSRRRRVASVQIEQLRAGRQRLLESYALVRRTLEEVHSDLQRADAEARVAADDAGRKAERELPEATVARATDPLGDDGDKVGVLPWRPDDNAHAAATALAEPPSRAAARDVVAGQPPTEAVEVDELLQRLQADDEQGADGDGDVSVREPDGQSLDDADEALLQKRDRAVIDIELSLTRKLKRALQDDQNSLLDRLRNLRGTPSAARLLPDEGKYRADLAGTAHPLLLEAAAAGAGFAAEQCREHGIQAGAGSERKPDVSDLVDELAGGITDPLRRRVEEAIDNAGDDQATLVDAIGAAYREWKSQRIERSVGDVVAAAFSRGSWSSVPDGTRLRWLPEDVDGPCPDCDDDSLAGALVKGEPWPTGQMHPPAHSGCRCLLVPVGD